LSPPTLEVLVVDDDKLIRDVVRKALEREGMRVAEAKDGAAALEWLREAAVHVAIVDVHMPGMSGHDLVARLRVEHPQLHVIMLTSAGTEAERVRGLVGGADDYVVKPFSARELTARVLAAGRRVVANGRRATAGDRIVIDAVARTVSVDGAPVDLTRREFDLLNYLAAHPGRPFTRAQLLRAVWESSSDWQSDATITEHVRRLRMKLERDPLQPQHLVTVKGTGYRFEPVPQTHAGVAGASS
jgi:two-component system, OmpR family, phosphate regulon response regulator PhoB